MSRIVMDSVSYAAVANLRWPHLIGYVNGHVSAWSADEIASTRARGQLLALVDVLGTAPLSASILDFERGDVQSPTVVRAWVQARNQYRGDAVVYCQPKSIGPIISGLRGEKCLLWVVDLASDGEPPFDVPAYPGLPDNVQVIGRQFVFGPRSGGNYDLSVFYADNWHPEQGEPVNYTAARAAAAAELGPVMLATAAATPLLTGGDMPGPAPTTNPPAAPPLAPEHAAAAAFAAAAAPVPVIHDDSTTAALAAAPRCPACGRLAGMPSAPCADCPDAAAPSSSSPAPATGSAAAPADPGQLAEHAADADQLAEHAAAAGQLLAEHAAAAAAPVTQSGLNHGFIRDVLTDVGTVAKMFRGAGHTTVAAELERAAGLAWELGSALKVAGL